MPCLSQWIKAGAKVDTINGNYLIKENRNGLDKPTWKGRPKRDKKYRRHKKKVKVWEELNRCILHYIRGTALVNGHHLKAELGRLKSRVEAFDLVKTTLDPVQNNKDSTSQEALDRFANLKLHLIKKGSFEKFIIQLEERVEDMAANNMALVHDENTLTLSLFNKLPYEAYKHVFLNMNQFQGMNYKDTLKRLQENTALIESVEAKSNKQKS